MHLLQQVVGLLLRATRCRAPCGSAPLALLALSLTKLPAAAVSAVCLGRRSCECIQIPEVESAMLAVLLIATLAPLGSSHLSSILLPVEVDKEKMEVDTEVWPRT